MIIKTKTLKTRRKNHKPNAALCLSPCSLGIFKFQLPTDSQLSFLSGLIFPCFSLFISAIFTHSHTQSLDAAYEINPTCFLVLRPSQIWFSGEPIWKKSLSSQSFSPEEPNLHRHRHFHHSHSALFQKMMKSRFRLLIRSPRQSLKIALSSEPRLHHPLPTRTLVLQALLMH